jgi:hypothetical protein
MDDIKKTNSFERFFLITIAAIILVPIVLGEILAMYISKENSIVAVETIKASIWATACCFLVSEKYSLDKHLRLRLRYIPLVWFSVFLFFMVMYRVLEYLQVELTKLLTFGFAGIGLQPYESFVNFISSISVVFLLLFLTLIVAKFGNIWIPKSADSVS